MLYHDLNFVPLRKQNVDEQYCECGFPEVSVLLNDFWIVCAKCGKPKKKEILLLKIINCLNGI